MRNAFLPLSALLLGVAAPCARADEPPPPKETQFFEALDKDLDGKVTLEEFLASGKDSAAFPLLDKNKDGAITPDELGLPADYKPAPRARGKDGAGKDGAGQPGKPGGPAAPGGGGEVKRRLKEMDTDGDGRITREEWKGEPEAFDRIDKNKDGVLDAQDGGGGGPGGARPPFDAEGIKMRWKKMDADGDGKVSREEYTGDFAFERLDQDKDGFLTEADLKGLQGAGGPGGPGGPRGQEPSPEQIERQFAEHDKDANGKLDAAELPEPIRERAMKADADGDGALSKEEFAAGLKKMRRAGAGEGKPPGPGGPGARGGGPELLKRFDHDKDGKVTREQFPGGDEQFAKLDANGDGVLTAEDFPPPPAPVAKPEAPGAGGPGGAAPPPPGGKLQALDKDGDGKLCRPEWPGSDEEWRALDKNTDGWVTADELPR